MLFGNSDIVEFQNIDDVKALFFAGKYGEAASLLGKKATQEGGRKKWSEKEKTSAKNRVVRELLLNEHTHISGFFNADGVPDAIKNDFLNYIANLPEEPKPGLPNLLQVLEILPIDILASVFLRGQRSNILVGTSNLMDKDIGKNVFKKLSPKVQLDLLHKFAVYRADQFVADFSFDEKAKIINAGLDQHLDENAEEKGPSDGVFVSIGAASSGPPATIVPRIAQAATAASGPVAAVGSPATVADAKSGVSPAAPPDTKTVPDAPPLVAPGSAISSPAAGNAATDAKASGAPTLAVLAAPPLPPTATINGAQPASASTATTPSDAKRAAREVNVDLVKERYALNMFQKLKTDKEKISLFTSTHFSSNAMIAVLKDMDLRNLKTKAFYDQTFALISSIPHVNKLARVLNFLADTLVKDPSTSEQKNSQDLNLKLLNAIIAKRRFNDLKVMFEGLYRERSRYIDKSGEELFIKLFKAMENKHSRLFKKKIMLLCDLSRDISKAIAKELFPDELVNYLSSELMDQKISFDLAVAALEGYSPIDRARTIIQLVRSKHTEALGLKLFEQIPTLATVNVSKPGEEKHQSHQIYPRVHVWFAILQIRKQQAETTHRPIKLALLIHLIMQHLCEDEKIEIAQNLTQDELTTLLKDPKMNPQIGLNLALAAIQGNQGPQKEVYTPQKISKLITDLENLEIAHLLFKKLNTITMQVSTPIPESKLPLSAPAAQPGTSLPESKTSQPTFVSVSRASVWKLIHDSKKATSIILPLDLISSLDTSERETIAKELPVKELIAYVTHPKMDQKISLELAVAAITNDPERRRWNTAAIHELLVALHGPDHCRKTSFDLFKQLEFITPETISQPSATPPSATPPSPSPEVKDAAPAPMLRADVWALTHKSEQKQNPSDPKHDPLSWPLELMTLLSTDERAQIANIKVLAPHELLAYLDDPRMQEKMRLELAKAAIDSYNPDQICDFIIKLYRSKHCKNVSLQLFKELNPGTDVTNTQGSEAKAQPPTSNTQITVTRAHIWLLIIDYTPKAATSSEPVAGAGVADQKDAAPISAELAKDTKHLISLLTHDLINFLEPAERAELLAQIYNPKIVNRLALTPAEQPVAENDESVTQIYNDVYKTRGEPRHPFRQIHGNFLTSDIAAKIATLNDVDRHISKDVARFKACLLLDAYNDISHPKAKKEFAELLNNSKLIDAQEIFAAFMLESLEHAIAVLEIDTKLFHLVGNRAIEDSEHEEKTNKSSANQLGLTPDLSLSSAQPEKNKVLNTFRTKLWQAIHANAKRKKEGSNLDLPLNLMKYFDEDEIKMILVTLTQKDLTDYLINPKLDKDTARRFAEIVIAPYKQYTDEIAKFIIDLYLEPHRRDLAKMLFQKLDDNLRIEVWIAINKKIEEGALDKSVASPKAKSGSQDSKDAAPDKNKVTPTSLLKDLIRSLDNPSMGAELLVKVYSPQKSKAAVSAPVVDNSPKAVASDAKTAPAPGAAGNAAGGAKLVPPSAVKTADAKHDPKSAYNASYQTREDKTHPFLHIHTTAKRMATLNAIEIDNDEERVNFKTALLFDAYKGMNANPHLKETFIKLMTKQALKDREAIFEKFVQHHPKFIFEILKEYFDSLNSENQKQLLTKFMLTTPDFAIAVLDIRKKKNGQELLKAFADPRIIEIKDDNSPARLNVLYELLTSENPSLSQDDRIEYFKCLDPKVRDQLFAKFMKLENPKFAIAILEKNRKWLMKDGMGQTLLKSFAKEAKVDKPDCPIIQSLKRVFFQCPGEIVKEYLNCLEQPILKKLVELNGNLKRFLPAPVSGVTFMGSPRPATPPAPAGGTAVSPAGPAHAAVPEAKATPGAAPPVAGSGAKQDGATPDTAIAAAPPAAPASGAAAAPAVQAAGVHNSGTAAAPKP